MQIPHLLLSWISRAVLNSYLSEQSADKSPFPIHPVLWNRHLLCLEVVLLRLFNSLCPMCHWLARLSACSLILLFRAGYLSRSIRTVPQSAECCSPAWVSRPCASCSAEPSSVCCLGKAETCASSLLLLIHINYCLSAPCCHL